MKRVFVFLLLSLVACFGAKVLVSEVIFVYGSDHKVMETFSKCLFFLGISLFSAERF